MAKTGLNIGADATIVASAGALAKAQNPFDMSKINQNLAETHAATMKSIGDTATNYINGVKELNKPLKDKWAEMQTMIADGTVESQQERDEMQAQLDIFREEMRGIPMGKKGQKQRDALIYKVNRYMKSHQADALAGESFSNTIVDESLYNAAQTEHEYPGFHALSTNLVDHLKNPNAPLPEGFSVKKNDQGVNEYTYQQDGIELSGTLSDLDGMLSRTDYTGIAEFEEVFGEVYENVKGNNLKTKDQVVSDLHDGAMQALNKNPNLYKSQIHQTVKGENTTFYKALMDPNSSTGQKIFTALATLHPELDNNEHSGSGDGVITKEDFATEENYNTLVNRLINPGAADTELAHELLTEFYIESEGMMAYNEGASHRTYKTVDDDNDDKKGDDPFIGDVYPVDESGETKHLKVTESLVAAAAEQFKNAERTNGSFYGFDGHSYMFENGQWYQQFRTKSSLTQGGQTDRKGVLGPKEKVSREKVLGNLFLNTRMNKYRIDQPQEVPPNLEVGVTSQGLGLGKKPGAASGGFFSNLFGSK
tara:strand:- start:937 stop:2544 length:1608 start_codon:yes stop_codon:yes gene_type:complete